MPPETITGKSCRWIFNSERNQIQTVAENGNIITIKQTTEAYEISPQITVESVSPSFLVRYLPDDEGNAVFSSLEGVSGPIITGQLHQTPTLTLTYTKDIGLEILHKPLQIYGEPSTQTSGRHFPDIGPLHIHQINHQGNLVLALQITATIDDSLASLSIHREDPEDNSTSLIAKFEVQVKLPEAITKALSTNDPSELPNIGLDDIIRITKD